MSRLQDAARYVLRNELDRRHWDDLQLSNQYELVTERIAELELALEDSGWLRLGDTRLDEFSRAGLRAITRMSRLFYLKNPLIQRGVNVQRYYVWGQGMSILAEDPDIDQVLQDFMADRKNIVELTGHQARMMKEVELQTDGNLFFVFFANPSSGQVRLRSIPFGEIDDIIRNPEDSQEPWFYRRRYTRELFSPTEGLLGEEVTEYYPDWRYHPQKEAGRINGKEVHWDRPVYHVRVGGFSDWKFGVSEVYAAIDWARAYKEFLEDWASIVRAYRRFAFTYTGATSAAEIAAFKARTGTTLGTGGTLAGETNPPPVTASIAAMKEGRDLQPVRTGGATVSAEDGRQLKLMVAAATGFPETFFGDVSVGTLATAKSLDRPTELAMRDRQLLWASIHMDVIEFVLLWAVKAPSGPLKTKGTVEEEEENGAISEAVVWQDDVDSTIDIDFPPLIEQDVGEAVGAIVDAATLKGFAPAGTMKMRDLVRLLLIALGEEDIDQVLADMFPDPGDDEELTWEEEEARATAAVFREAIVEVFKKASQA